MQIRSILLPTDFSECGNYALSYAASLARTFGASIICVHVIEPMVPTVGYSGMTEPLPIADITDQLEDSAERELPKFAECEECAGLEIEEVDCSRRSGCRDRARRQRTRGRSDCGFIARTHRTGTNSFWFHCRSGCAPCFMSGPGGETADRGRNVVSQ